MKNQEQLREMIAKLDEEERQLNAHFNNRIRDHAQFIEQARARQNQITGAKTTLQQLLEPEVVTDAPGT